MVLHAYPFQSRQCSRDACYPSCSARSRPHGIRQSDIEGIGGGKFVTAFALEKQGIGTYRGNSGLKGGSSWVANAENKEQQVGQRLDTGPSWHKRIPKLLFIQRETRLSRNPGPAMLVVDDTSVQLRPNVGLRYERKEKKARKKSWPPRPFSLGCELI